MVERAAPALVGLAFYMSRTLRVPIFPLSGALLFPRSQLPLHIFEPRYREMTRDAIDSGGQIAMIQPQRYDDDNKAPLYAVGCVGEIVGVEEMDDGRFNIISATSAFSGQPRSRAACSNAAQNMGSRLIDV